MAKFFQRMGTKQQVFSYEITIHYVQLALTVPVRISVIWKRRKKRIETKLHPALSPSVGSVELNESLTMINTLYQEKSGQFQRKKALLTVQAIIDGKGAKRVGNISINISEYHSTPLREQVFPLENCPDRNAKVCLSVTAVAVGGLEAADNQSEASGTLFSMGTEGDIDVELFEQDLVGFDDESKSPRNKNFSRKFFEMPKIVNPVKISENIHDDNSQIKELQSKNIMLETQKETLQEELNTFAHKFQNEKEELHKHIKNIDAENSKLKTAFERVSGKLKRREETLAKMKKINENLIQDLKNLEQGEDVASLQDKIHKLEENNTSLQDRLEKVSSENKFQYEKTIKKLNIELEQALDHKHNSSLQGSIDQLKAQLREASRKVEDLEMNQFRLEDENKELKKEINKTIEVSEPASVILQEQLQFTRKKLESIENEHEIEKTKLWKRIKELENKLQESEKQNREISNQLNTRSPTLEDEHPSLLIANIEIQELKEKVLLGQADYTSMEKKYMDSKMGWANTDLERENLAQKLKETQEKLRECSSAYTAMEVELYKLNERFGQTLNENNELEMEIHSLKKVISESGKKKKK